VRKNAAFTLIELLVVVSIIALLVAMLLPTLGRARALARKTSCRSQMSNYGTALAIYIAQYHTYPHFAPWSGHWTGSGYAGNDDYQLYPGPPGVPSDVSWGPINWGKAWPKFYTILQEMGIKGNFPTRYGIWYYFWQPDDVVDGVMCPSLDWLTMWEWMKARAAGSTGISDVMPYFHRAAMAYQWNFTLRCGVPGTTSLWPPVLQPNPACDYNDNTWWIGWGIILPGGQADHYGTQAVSPEQVADPQTVAEGWDSWDLPEETAASLPGWHVGPNSRSFNGWFLLNAGRHLDGPNILYADGHVASDATRRLTDADFPGASGFNAVSYGDYHEIFGTLRHILPKMQFEGEAAK